MELSSISKCQMQTILNIFIAPSGFRVNVLAWHSKPFLCAKNTNINTTVSTPKQPWVKNVKKIHLCLIKRWMMAWWTASCVCKPLHLETAWTSLGSSEDICWNCGLHIPHCEHSHFSTQLFGQAKLIYQSSSTRMQTHSLTNTERMSQTILLGYKELK